MVSNVTSSVLAIASLVSSTVLAGTGLYLSERFNQESRQHIALEELNANRQLCLETQAQAMALRTSVADFESADPVLKLAISDLYKGSAQPCKNANLESHNINQLFNDQLQKDKDPAVAAYAKNAETIVRKVRPKRAPEVLGFLDAGGDQQSEPKAQGGGTTDDLDLRFHPGSEAASSSSTLKDLEPPFKTRKDAPSTTR